MMYTTETFDIAEIESGRIAAGWKVKRRSERKHITLDGCTGDYREVCFELDGKLETVAVSSEFGFQDHFDGDRVGDIKWA